MLSSSFFSETSSPYFHRKMANIQADENPVDPGNAQAQQDQDMDMPQAQAQVPIIAPLVLPRIRRTHKDDIISSFLSKLSLREKLSKNKEIEDQNKAREAKKFNHHIDPVAHPDTGSENASFITIDEADLKDLKDPSIFGRFVNFIPDYLLLLITREIRADKEDREKRKTEDLNPHMSELSQDAKRRRMDGSKAAERIIGFQREIEFSEILFTTNAHVPIPLPFFRNANLRYIIDQAATLPTTKSNPLPGETKGQFILNISDMTKGFKGCKIFDSTKCRIRMETWVLTPPGGLLTLIFLTRRKTKLPNTTHGRNSN